jgi:MFS family permease
VKRLHPAWLVAAVAFVALVGAAGFRATPGVLIHPLHDEFGWSLGTISLAVSINLLLFGLTAPFAAALMERWGIRRVVAYALLLVSAGSGLTVFMRHSWELIALWGVLVGLGTGSMALAFVATVTGRWFVKRRGLVTGVLTAGGAAGQLVFLPVLALLAEAHGWRSAALTVAAAALAVVPLVLWRLRDNPADLGVTAYGADGVPAHGAAGEPAHGSAGVPAHGAAGEPAHGSVGVTAYGSGGVTAHGSAGEPAHGSAGATAAAPPSQEGAARRALGALRTGARTPAFWLLAGGFAICGATTNGLIGTHFIPAAHDHGMSEPTAASLLALVGLFDIVGTVASGWLTDRMDSRILLGWYYALRGLSLLVLPILFAATVRPSMLVFILFYGLDWVATVPPTVALCREYFGAAGPVVFGWVFASHQFGAAIAATTTGVLRDRLGNYDLAWYIAGGLSISAAALSLMLFKTRNPAPAPAAAPAAVAA